MNRDWFKPLVALMWLMLVSFRRELLAGMGSAA